MNNPIDPTYTLRTELIKNEWLEALSKGASALRFSANNWECTSEEAKKELLRIVEHLNEIEVAFIKFRDQTNE